MIEQLTYVLYAKTNKDGASIQLQIQNQFYKDGPKGSFRKDITTGIKVAREQWIGSSRFGPWIKGDDEVTYLKNAAIKEILDKLDVIFMKVRKQTNRVPWASEVADIYQNGFQEKPRKKVLEYVPEYITAKAIEPNTARVYRTSFTEALKRFLKNKYNVEDMFIDEIDTPMIYRFEMFMATSNTKFGKPYSKGTAREYMNKLKAIVSYALKAGEIDEDVLAKYTPTNALKPDKAKDIVASLKEAVMWKIDPDELYKIETIPITGRSIQGDVEEDGKGNQFTYDLVRARLCFLLQTWTGFAYADLEKMRNVKHVIRMDLTGKESIIYNRAKNGELAILPLFPQAKTILEALDYNAHPNCSYETYLRKIKALFRHYAIELNNETAREGTHVGRHLFGSRMLTMGFSMESISRMMGHTTIKETEKVYAQIDLTKINTDWDRIRQTTEELGKRIAI